VSGNYVYTGVKTNQHRGLQPALSPSGNSVLAEGDFTSVGGVARQQIFMLSLGPAGHGERLELRTVQSVLRHQPAVLYPVSGLGAGRLRGLHRRHRQNPHNWNHTFPLTGLCSAVAAFPSTQSGSLTPDWINYTGCDSLYSVAVDPSAVYVGGSERWADNASRL